MNYRAVLIVSIVMGFMSLLGIFLSPWYAVGVVFPILAICFMMYSFQFRKDRLELVERRLARIESNLALPEIQKMMNLVTGRKK